MSAVSGCSSFSLDVSAMEDVSPMEDISYSPKATTPEKEEGKRPFQFPSHAFTPAPAGTTRIAGVNGICGKRKRESGTGYAEVEANKPVLGGKARKGENGVKEEAVSIEDKLSLILQFVKDSGF